MLDYTKSHFTESLSKAEGILKPNRQVPTISRRHIFILLSPPDVYDWQRPYRPKGAGEVVDKEARRQHKLDTPH